MTTTQPRTRRPDRSEGISYDELLDLDTRQVPEVLRLVGDEDIGPMEIPTAWYLDREIHELEKQRLWKKVWQMACRLEELPEVGDTVVYDICDISVIVVRVAPVGSGPDEIKAYYNSCLHRGRPMRDFDGRVKDLQCPFHGFTWRLDGSLKTVPCAWDFPHVTPEEFRLPEIRVGTWGGFVFINLDPHAEPLEDFLGELVEHFRDWRLEDRHTVLHVAKVIPANWKAVQDAFNEGYHTVTTHPQLLPGLGDANGKYDSFGNFSRMLVASGTPSPHITGELTAQQIANGVVGGWDDETPMVPVPDGFDPRAALAEAIRFKMAPYLGDRVSSISDAEMVDTISYQLFPNLKPWGGYVFGLVYRLRPYGDDHTRSIFDVYLLLPLPPEQRMQPTTIHLGEGQPWTDVPELGQLAGIFNQDTLNLDQITKGLRNNPRGKLTLGRYQELDIRHFFALWQRWLGVDGTGAHLDDARRDDTGVAAR
jgi:phenylpropionate dioxygenase-like ring-hydroxylating dioxygenase large terminal subunit